MDNDPPIKVGDVVFVDCSLMKARPSYVGKVDRFIHSEEVGVLIDNNQWKNATLENVFHATQAQKREYFKRILKDG
jgi:hypothetical protein